MKKFLLLFLIILYFVHPVFAQSGEHIQSFNSQITVNKDGTINVKETIVYDFGSLSRHGIYRYIPYIKNINGKRYKMDIKVISVKDENGQNYNYQLIDSNNQTEIKIGDANKTITGVHTYVIEYSVSGALGYFSDHDEIYWNATGNDWIVPIASSTSEVELPDGISKSDIKTNCFTGNVGSSEQSCTAKVDGNNVTFNSNGSLNSSQGMTVAVSFPKNIVAVLQPKPYVTFWETIYGKITIALIILAAIFWYIIYPIKIIYKWIKSGRDPKAPTGPVQAWYDPPKLKTGRFLSPEETGSLVDETVDLQDLSGMIVYLAQKGFIKIVEKEKDDFYFEKTKEFSGDDNLTSYEKEFLNQIFVDKDEVQLKKNKMYEAVDHVKKLIYDQLVKDGLFPQNPNSIRTFYSVVGGMALFMLNLELVLAAFIFGRNLPRKTVDGVEAANEAKSLKNFLSSQERQLEFQAKNQMMFEKLLPYAIVFGVEKIWAERFKDIDMKPPDWYQGYGGGQFNSVYLASSLNSSFSSFQSAATPPSSSGSGFSGGFSGGGGGGGGGGSW